MTVTPWIAGRRRELARTRVLTLHEQRFECVDFPDRSGDFTVVECADWVIVAALTPSADAATENGPGLVLIEQFRFGIAANALELPGGMVDPGEDPLAAGVRELEEETGYVGENARIVATFDANPAFLTNRVFTVLVENATPSGKTNLDPSEQIEASIVPLSGVAGMVAAGQITHTVAIAGLFRVFDEVGQLGR
ncbi:MAG: NUDIX hydrolase [Planctomycetota bacterium]